MPVFGNINSWMFQNSNPAIFSVGIESYIEDMGTWLSADSVEVSGSDITQFTDLSGNSRHATPKSTAATLVEGKREEHDAARTNETPYNLGGGHDALDIKSVIFVAQKQIYSNNGILLHLGYTDYISAPKSITTRRIYGQLNDGTSYQGVSSEVDDVNKLVLGIVRKDDSDNKIYSYVNSDDSDNIPSAAQDGRYWNIDEIFEYGGSGSNFNGFFFEMITLTKDLTDSDIAFFRNYFNNKYNIWGRSSYWLPKTGWQNLESIDALRKVVFFGDSLWTKLNDMKTRIEGTDTIRGYGYVNFRDNGLWKLPLIRMEISGATLVDSQDSAENWGIQGECLDLSSTGTIDVWNMGTPSDDWREDLRFNSASIYFLKQSGGGSFRWNVDGGDWTTVDTDNASTELGVELITISGELDDHTVYIEGVSGTCRMFGMRTWDEASSGVVFDYVHVGGSAAQEWEAYGQYNYAMLADVDPDKIFVWLAFNDRPLLRTKEQFKSDMESIISDLKTHCPNADIIMLTHHDAGAGANYDEQYTVYDDDIDEYDDAIREMQIADSTLSVIDIDHVAYDRYYGRNTEIIYSDAVHYSITGGPNFVNPYIIEALYD